MTTVYRIDTYDIHNNEYCVNREESWQIRKVKVFDRLDDAKDYVRKKSIRQTDFLLFSHNVKDDEMEEALDNFCFKNDLYMRYRRFFVGDVVSFRAEDGQTVTGVLVRLNKKTVTVHTESGTR